MHPVLSQAYVKNAANKKEYKPWKKTFREGLSPPATHEMPKMGFTLEITFTPLGNKNTSLALLSFRPKSTISFTDTGA